MDIETLEKVTDITVGSDRLRMSRSIRTAPTIYAIATEEAAVAVIDTATWEVTERINIGTNPSSIYFRAGS